MGLLTEGSPLAWSETKKHADHVRKHGIVQFLHIFDKVKDIENDCLKWGDEVEYTLIRLDHENKTAQLSLRGNDILPSLQEEELQHPEDVETAWRPEYAKYMIEGTPGKPFGGCMRHFNMVEHNMRKRREEINKVLASAGETAMSVTAFPRLGCPNFTYPSYDVTPEKNGVSRSLFYPDQAINAHPRFSTLTRNIRERRGKKVAINIPIFKDVNTPSPFIEKFLNDDGEAAVAAKPDHIYMDAMGFGMGCSCLQMTFQACSITEARHLYDQLAVLTPIVLALSAASPIYRGYLADVDCRWNVISASVDDRTDEERGEKPLKENRFVIPKSRYDSIDCYLSPSSANYNDIPLVIDEEICQQLKEGSLDELLARHISHLFIRDPLTLFSERIHLDDQQDSDHFENIQSTNWQTMRFKPPPANSSIGWRVEFRPTEVQLTDFENAAYVVFVVLLTRVILSYNIDIRIPISKVEENMKEAQKRDAVRKGKFYFRKTLERCNTNNVKCIYAVSTQMTIDEIINGKDGVFIGLVPLIKEYMDGGAVDIDVDTRCTISQYLKFIGRRASGELMTTARWLRDSVESHPEYNKDSVVTDKINYDLMVKCDKISRGELGCPELFGTPLTKTDDDMPIACKKAQKDVERISEHRRFNGVNIYAKTT